MKSNQKHTPIEIMQFMTHDSLQVYKKIGSKASIKQLVDYQNTSKEKYKKGVVFVSPSKPDLENGKGYIVTSYETLHEKCNSLTHWTPNTFRGGTYYNFKKRIIKGHTRDNLKQINVIGFDIDTKNVDLYALFLGCDELDLPRPNLLLETDKGFQGFFVLETPFYINNKNDYKSLRVAARLSENILDALNKYVPIDFSCAPFGFFRIPNNQNITYFDDMPANTEMLLYWSKQYEKNNKKPAFNVIYSPDNAAALGQVSSEWYSALISSKNIEKGHFASSRNNALLTLALANYENEVPFEHAYDELDEFNSNLSSPLSKREFERVLKSAYSGKYKGAKRSYVEQLLELWTDGQAQFNGKEGWYKFKKPREERQRSHYEEREEDILAYLERHTSPTDVFCQGSIRALAETFGMAASTLKEVLKRSNKLIKRTIGRGRNAVTMIASRAMLFRSFLHQRRERIKHAQLTFAQILPNQDNILEVFDIPYLFEELESYRKMFDAQPGASPSERLII